MTLAESAEASDRLAASSANEATRLLAEMNARWCRELLSDASIPVVRIPSKENLK